MMLYFTLKACCKVHSNKFIVQVQRHLKVDQLEQITQFPILVTFPLLWVSLHDQATYRRNILFGTMRFRAQVYDNYDMKHGNRQVGHGCWRHSGQLTS